MVKLKQTGQMVFDSKEESPKYIAPVEEPRAAEGKPNIGITHVSYDYMIKSVTPEQLERYRATKPYGGKYS